MQAEMMSNVYEPDPTSEDDIIDKHAKELGSHNITIPNDNRKPPLIYTYLHLKRSPQSFEWLASGTRSVSLVRVRHSFLSSAAIIISWTVELHPEAV